jgi:hypothetical protein
MERRGGKGLIMGMCHCRATIIEERSEADQTVHGTKVHQRKYVKIIQGIFLASNTHVGTMTVVTGHFHANLLGYLTSSIWTSLFAMVRVPTLIMCVKAGRVLRQ